MTPPPAGPEITDEYLERRWRWATIEAYKPLEWSEGWSVCPKCSQRPRTWVFDNGNYAKCLCGSKYGGGVSAPCILDWCHRDKKPYEEWRDLLKAAWNQHVAALKAALSVQAGERA